MNVNLTPFEREGLKWRHGEAPPRHRVRATPSLSAGKGVCLVIRAFGPPSKASAVSVWRTKRYRVACDVI